ncbi:MAG: MMPL family transporter [Deltaproteobacteria bacterium]|nr:MMPL family transporter [Deltaproteobacteria bacterium]
MIRRWAEICAHRPRTILALCLTLFALMVAVLLFVPQRFRTGGFEDPGRESWHVNDHLVANLDAGPTDIAVVYTAPEGGTVDDPEMMVAVESAVARATANPSVIGVTSFYETAASELVSKDRTRTLVLARLKGDDHEKIAALAQLRQDLLAPPLKMDFGGYVPLNQAVLSTVKRDLIRGEAIALPLTLVALVTVFGSVAAAALPVLIGGIACLFSMAVLVLLALFTSVNAISINVVTIMGLGLSIDYSLLLVTRMREELRDHSPVEAAITTVTTAGRAVAFSAVVVMCSLGGLLVFPQAIVRTSGIGAIVVLLGTLAIALTFLPALLVLLGPRIDALRIPFGFRAASSANVERTGWYRFAKGVMRRPIAVIVVITLGLLTLAIPFLRFAGSVPDHRVLPPGSEVRTTIELINREFIPNIISPHEILVYTEGEALGAENLDKLGAFSDAIAGTEGVARVIDIFSRTPAGMSRADFIVAIQKLRSDPSFAQSAGIFVRGNVMRFMTISAYDSPDPRGMDTVRRLRKLPLPVGMRMEVGGVSANLLDLQLCVADRTPWMLLFISVAMIVVLFLAFGSLVLPLKAIVMNVLSLSASFGAIVWIFQDGRLTWLLQYESLGVSEALQPILMFCTVFGLSMDYEVFLLARVAEERDKGASNDEAIALGLARTGQPITTAALLFVLVVAAFATSVIITVKSLGVGMALAVFIDATIVRAVLVPSTMKLLGRWCWWAPASLGGGRTGRWFSASH